MSAKSTKNIKQESVEPAKVGQHQIDIDFGGLIDLLSNHLYKDKSAVIRELLSNSNDSLIKRCRQKEFNSENALIQIWLDSKSAQLIIQDNGIGMSEDDLIKYLSTIGASLTKEAKEKAESDFENLIGRYGVGFLSSFIVADHISVETQKEGNACLRWESRGQRDFTITKISDQSIGTKVILDLKSDIIAEWNESQIKKMVLENARNFIFPIFWGIDKNEKLNDLQAPWYIAEDVINLDLNPFREFLVGYDDRFTSALNAPEIIPILSDDIKGVVFIPATSALSHERLGLVDLYCNRVFVCKDDSEIVPDEFGFIKGVIDCKNFKLSVSRDSVQKDNHVFNYVKDFIGFQIIEYVCKIADLAKNSDKDGEDVNEIYKIRIQTLLDNFHLLFKNALVKKNKNNSFVYKDVHIIRLEHFMPFQSSTGLFTSIPDYITRMTSRGREKEILILRPNEDLMSQTAIHHQEKREFIVAHRPIEEEYLKRYSEIKGIKCISAQEAITDEFPKLTIDENWEKIIHFFKERCNHHDFRLSVFLSEFEPENVAGRLLKDKHPEGSRELQELLTEIEKTIEDKSDPIFNELSRLKQKRPYILFVNKNNPLLKKIANLKEGEIDLEQILHPLLHDIIISAGQPLHEIHLSAYQVRTYAELLTALETKKELKNTKAQLADEIKSRNDLEIQIKSLEQNIFSLESKYSNKEIQTTNDVFFIRPMKDGKDNYDYISKKLSEICEKSALELIDPKAIHRPGNILEEIIDNLKKSRIVIADITENNVSTL